MNLEQISHCAFQLNHHEYLIIWSIRSFPQIIFYLTDPTRLSISVLHYGQVVWAINRSLKMVPNTLLYIIRWSASALRKKCPNPYSVWMRENTDRILRKNSVFGHFSCSANVWHFLAFAENLCYLNCKAVELEFPETVKRANCIAKECVLISFLKTKCVGLS